MFASLRAWVQKHWRRRPAASRRAALCIDFLEDRLVPATITYNGGPLLNHVEVQGVYFGPQWSRAANASQVSYLEGFLNTIVPSSYLNTLTQAGYRVGPGTDTPGKMLQGGMGHGHTVSDGQLRQALLGTIKKGQLQAPDANRLYLIFVQPGTVVRLKGGGTSGKDFSNYQATFRGKVPGGQRATINYAVVAYPRAADVLPGLSTQETLTTLASRALVDAVTDPGAVPGRVGNGWNDIFGKDIADYGNSYVHLDGYAVQRVVDQNVVSLTPAGATAAPQEAFALQANGDLIEQTATGTQKVLANVATVSPPGIDAHGHAMVDAVLTDGQAFEVHAGGAAVSLGTGVTEARAGQIYSYVLLQDGTLEQFGPRGLVNKLSDPTSSAHPAKVTSFTLGLNLSGANVVDAVFADGSTRTFTDTTFTSLP